MMLMYYFQFKFLKKFVRIWILFLVQITQPLFAQQDIVNGDFELWDTIPGTNGLEDPVGWKSNNEPIYNCLNGNYISGISKSTDAYSGNFSLKISPSNNPSSFFSNMSRIIHTSDTCSQSNYNCNSMTCYYTPMTYQYQKLMGYNKFLPDTALNDTARIGVTLINETYTPGNPFGSGGGEFGFPPSSQWTYFEFVIGGNNLNIPSDKFIVGIWMASYNLSTDPNGYLLLDDLEIVALPVSNNNLQDKLDCKLSPNPANDLLSIQTTSLFQHYHISNIFGKSIEHAFFKNNIDVSSLPSGIYFLELSGIEKNTRFKFIKK